MNGKEDWGQYSTIILNLKNILNFKETTFLIGSIVMVFPIHYFVTLITSGLELKYYLACLVNTGPITYGIVFW